MILRCRRHFEWRLRTRSGLSLGSQSSSTSYRINNEQKSFSQRLQGCLQKADDTNSHNRHHVCLEVLEWGGVEGVSSKWLRESCADASLRCRINKAVDLLKAGPTHSEWDRFDGEDLVMNSGVTKIYALAAPEHIPIYDGRVGAGLGLLVRKCLEERYVNEVPDERCFPWGAGQATSQKRAAHLRNPSCPPYTFPCLWRGGRNPDRYHAKWCWRAGRILREAVKKLNEGGMLCS